MLASFESAVNATPCPENITPQTDGLLSKVNEQNAEYRAEFASSQQQIKPSKILNSPPNRYKIMRIIIITIFFISLHLSSCGLSSSDTTKQTIIIVDSIKINHYPWLMDYTVESMLINRIQPPEGYKRLPVTTGGFAHWLRHLPLKAVGTPVYLFNGDLKSNQQVHEAVVDIDVGERDLQQCADAVMRLRAEYFYNQKAYKKIHFNFTSGHSVNFDDWRKGKKPVVKGNKVTFTKPTGNIDNTYQHFKKYLQIIFNYAGSYSLEKELSEKTVNEIKIGDVFIKGGFPGHAVLVVDLAIDKEGNQLMLLAQSYMPAQDIHILKNRYDKNISPWFEVDFGQQLYTPEWTFDKGSLRRF